MSFSGMIPGRHLWKGYFPGMHGGLSIGEMKSSTRGSNDEPFRETIVARAFPTKARPMCASRIFRLAS